MLEKLSNHTKLKPIANPRALKGKLRAYQKRGVAWLQYLEKLGLNACLAEQESVLIFTQFTEIGDNLHKYLKQKLNYNSYYLHGRTTRNKREQMITEFQAPEDQATDRAFRIGQHKNVFVHKFIALGTLEERIDQMLVHIIFKLFSENDYV
jgi:SNF2 family DNA or RNA helicase